MNATPLLTGLHHVTAIAGHAQRNLDFWARLPGLRLVKRTVNFDDPSAYHFYYGDREGRAGSAVTFFPWEGLRAGRPGAGMTEGVLLAVAPDTLDAVADRVAALAGASPERSERFGEPVVAFRDPDGLPVAYVGTPAVPETGVALYGAALLLADPEPTARLLTDVMGYEAGGEADGRLRFRARTGGPGAVLDLVAAPRRGLSGAGTVHHIAFRTPDAADQAAWRERLLDAGLDVSPVRDRQYFRSIYFREPGGVLFEIATDGPGFALDEPVNRLGTGLMLPPWVEPHRAAVERALPAITLPQ